LQQGTPSDPQSSLFAPVPKRTLRNQKRRKGHAYRRSPIPFFPMIALAVRI
jgi:hypothetical protein